MEKETTPMYDTVKQVIENFRSNKVDNDEIARFIAEDISQAVVDVYGKNDTAVEILDSISYEVHSRFNPALEN